MRWLALLLMPLILWAVLFAAVYGLHGLGCAWGWPLVRAPLGSLQSVAMVVIWLGGLGLHLLILRATPHGAVLPDRLRRLAGWSGFGASLLTLWPMLVSSSCTPSV